MRYLAFLDQVHAKLRPKTYLEIGIRNGTSLALSRSRTVAIDPAYHITAEISCDLRLFRTTSDEYFSRADPLSPTDGRAFDLAFIDGLHLFEFALRDFIHAERHSSAKAVIIFDDVLPRNRDEAARVRHTRAWTGDVYSIIAVLARYRPELTVIPVNTTPTGLLLVLGLDPQTVPEELMDRLSVLPPQRVLDAGVWDVLADAHSDASPAQVRHDLQTQLVALGEAFGGQRGGGEAA
jgi:predicted O-methyltransferase YrrM